MVDEAAGDPRLPHAVALTWGVAERPQRGPKRELSIERIVESAIEIADSEGLGAVSMSRVAGSLGFTTMSLYRYVTSKDDLLLLMQDAVSSIPLPEATATGAWRDGLRTWALSTLQVFLDHPWFADIPISGVPMTPNSLVLIDWGLRELRAVSLTAHEKMSVLLLLSGHVRAFGVIERDIDHAQLAGAGNAAVPTYATNAALRELVTAERFPDLAPLVQSGDYSDDEDDHDDFAFGLERILDGVERYIDDVAAGRSSPTPARPAPEIAHPRDKAVREAAKARREASARLREALKREREADARAAERAKKTAADAHTAKP